MNNQEFDSLLRRVVVDSIKNYTEQFSNNDLLFSPSVGYGRQVRMMLANPLGWAKKRIFPIWKKTLRAVAMIFITIFVAMGCLIAFSSPVRAAVKRWFYEIHEKYFSYIYAGELENYEIQDYEITILPDGFMEDKRDKFPSLVNVVYKNDCGEYIYLRYISVEQGSLFFTITDGIKSTDVNVHNMEGKYLESPDSDSMSTIMWIDQDSNLQFTIDSHLSFLELMHMAESVSLCKHTN